MSSSGPFAASSSASASASTPAAASTFTAPDTSLLPTHFVRLNYLDPSPKKGWVKQLLATPRGASALPPLRPAELAPLQELLRCGAWFDAGHPFRELDAAGAPHVQLYLARTAERLVPMLFISRAHVERLALHASAAMRARQPGAWARELHIPASRPGTWAREELVGIVPVTPRRAREVSQLRSNITQELEDIEAAMPQRSYVSWPAAYESLRALWQRSTLPSAPAVPLLLAVDVETWEMSHQGNQKEAQNPSGWALEIGWSLISPSTPRAGAAPTPWSERGGSRRPMKDAARLPQPGSWMQETHHYLVDRHYPARKNGRYCADQRHNFLFGPPSERSGAGQEAPYKNGSRIASMEDITRELNATLLLARETDTPVFVTFHDADGDLPTLQGMGILTNTWLRGPEGIHTVCNWLPGSGRAPICVLDTSALIAAVRGDDYSAQHSLGTVALALNVNDGVIEGMHNAANDAFYTAAVGATLAAGPPLPQMRALLQPRWEAAKEQGKKRTPAQHSAMLAKQNEELPEEIWLSPWAMGEPSPASAVTDKLTFMNEVRAVAARSVPPPDAAQQEQEHESTATSAAAESSKSNAGASKQATVAATVSTPTAKKSEPVDPLVLAAAQQAAEQAQDGARAQLVAQARTASQLRSPSQLKVASQPQAGSTVAAPAPASPSPRAVAQASLVPQSRIAQGKLYARDAESHSLPPRQPPSQSSSLGVPLRSARVQAAISAPAASSKAAPTLSSSPPPRPLTQGRTVQVPVSGVAARTSVAAKPAPIAQGVHVPTTTPSLAARAAASQASTPREAPATHASSSATTQPATASVASNSTSKLKTWPAPTSRTTQTLAEVLLNEQRREAAELAKSMASQTQSTAQLEESSRGTKRDAPSSPPGSPSKQRAKAPQASGGYIEPVGFGPERFGYIASTRWPAASDERARRWSGEGQDQVSIKDALDAYHEYRDICKNMVLAATKELGYQPVVFFRGEALHPLRSLASYRQYFRTDDLEMRDSFRAAWKEAMNHFELQPVAVAAVDKLRELKRAQGDVFWASACGQRLLPTFRYMRSTHARSVFGTGSVRRHERSVREVDEARLRAERLGEWRMDDADNDVSEIELYDGSDDDTD